MKLQAPRALKRPASVGASDGESLTVIFDLPDLSVLDVPPVLLPAFPEVLAFDPPTAEAWNVEVTALAGDGLEPPTGPRKTPRRWRRPRSVLVAALAAVVVIALVAAGVVLTSSSPAKQYRISFPLEATPQSGVTVSRTWIVYGGRHPSLHGDLVFNSTNSQPTQVEELLPKSLVSRASQVSFSPQPRVVGDDPVVVSYTVSSVEAGTNSAAYDVPISGRDVSMAALTKWANEQSQEAGLRYRQSHTLASLVLAPATVVLKRGGPPYQLIISGLQSDGSAAPTIAFGGAHFTVDNPTIASVSQQGAVSGLKAGRTTVRARLGSLSGSAVVIVSSASNAKTTPAASVTALAPAAGALGQPLGSPGLPVGVSSPGHPGAGPQSGKTDHGTHHVPPVVTHQPPPVVGVPAPVCTNPPGPANVAAILSAANAITVSWAAPSIPAPCVLSGYTITGTDGAGTVLSSVLGVGSTSATFTVASGTSQFAVVASYGQLVSPPVSSNSIVVPVPQPVCAPGSLSAPTGLAAVPDTTVAGAVAVSWGASPVPVGCPAVSSYDVSVNGASVAQASGSQTSAALSGLNGAGPLSLVVSVTYADGTTFASAPLAFTAAVTCPDGSVAMTCPAPPAPPGP